MHKLILASNSPRRKALLTHAGIKHDVVPSNYVEDMTLALPPQQLAQHLSHGKAHNVACMYPNHVIIAADTFIVHNNTILGKPHTPTKAREMLEHINNSIIDVITGVTVCKKSNGTYENLSTLTRIYTNNLSTQQICDYVATGEPLDKAGAFAIQGYGAIIVKKIDGSYTNIIGLPMEYVENMLATYNINFSPSTHTWDQDTLHDIF